MVPTRISDVDEPEPYPPVHHGWDVLCVALFILAILLVMNLPGWLAVPADGVVLFALRQALRKAI
jgi:hypothetical protein